MNRFAVRRVAVLGAGVMGAQIAAALANARFPVLLFDLPSPKGPRSGVAAQAIERLKALKPAPLGHPSDLRLIQPANYDDDLAQLAGCELVIEAVVERMDIKRSLYERVAGHVGPEAVIVSNTSGLSVDALAESCPEALRPRFCGVHFFNPPRYMPLVELIPTAYTRPGLLNALETFVTSALGKSVVRARDTPNFVANRVGVAQMLSTLREAEHRGLSYEVVDELTGRRLGRASSGTFRTADVVGLDVFAHAIGTMREQLPDDPFHSLYAEPPVLTQLLAGKALGQKNGQGFFRKVGREIQHFVPATGDYEPATGQVDEAVAAMLKLPAPERLAALHASEHPQAAFVWAVLRDGFHYAAVQLAEIAETARDIDLAMRWGFGMQQGPFELWQQAGWREVAEWVREDIAAGRATSRAPLPDWVFEGPVAERGGVHMPEGSWSASEGAFLPVSSLPVYERQIFREGVSTARPGDKAGSRSAGTVVSEGANVRTWTLPSAPEVLVASLLTKGHVIGPGVVDGLREALERAEKDFAALVLWSPEAPFSYGADLAAIAQALREGGAAAVAPQQTALQELMLALRRSTVPSVAAVHGPALGGGCELALHASRRVVAFECGMGLVEAGVGLIPGGGGLACLARRAAQAAYAVQPPADLTAFLRDAYTAVATARVSTSASDCRASGFLTEGDVVVPHTGEVLHVALTQASALADSAWRAPTRDRFAVAGRSGAATLKAAAVNLREGGFISAHDYTIAAALADALCGGDVDAGSLVDEEYMMAMERRYFGELLAHPLTQARIASFLETGKPLRN